MQSPVVGTGLYGRTHRIAGSGLEAECRALRGSAVLAPGEALVTHGHNLPAAHVVHAVIAKHPGPQARALVELAVDTVFAIITKQA